MATHSSILAWEIPWTEGPGGLQSKGLQRVGHNWTHTHTHTHTHTQSSRVLYLKIMNMEYFPLENNVDFLQLPVKVSKDVSYFVI